MRYQRWMLYAGARQDDCGRGRLLGRGVNGSGVRKSDTVRNPSVGQNNVHEKRSISGLRAVDLNRERVKEHFRGELPDHIGRRCLRCCAKVARAELRASGDEEVPQVPFYELYSSWS